VKLAAIRSWMAAASVQNSESACGAVFSVVSLALELELELDDVESEAFESSSDPPQAVSRTTAAAAARPLRHRERVRRMVGRLTAA